MSYLVSIRDTSLIFIQYFAVWLYWSLIVKYHSHGFFHVIVSSLPSSLTDTLIFSLSSMILYFPHQLMTFVSFVSHSFISPSILTRIGGISGSIFV